MSTSVASRMDSLLSPLPPMPSGPSASPFWRTEEGQKMWSLSTALTDRVRRHVHKTRQEAIAFIRETEQGVR